jgi:hypothetical protein
MSFPDVTVVSGKLIGWPYPGCRAASPQPVDDAPAAPVRTGTLG